MSKGSKELERKINTRSVRRYIKFHGAKKGFYVYPRDELGQLEKLIGERIKEHEENNAKNQKKDILSDDIIGAWFGRAISETVTTVVKCELGLILDKIKEIKESSRKRGIYCRRHKQNVQFNAECIKCSLKCPYWDIDKFKRIKKVKK